MKVVEKIVEDKNYTAINLGNLDELMEYSLIHKVNKQKIEGKVFLKEPTNATGTEISFNSLAAKTEQPYFHIHYKNEETYIILKGYGFFQVDGNCFEIKEGSVIRVAPAGIRGIRNDSDETMIYMVVQSKENSLEEYTTDDGERVAFEPKWGNKMNKALLIIDIQNDYFKGGNCELINPQIASFNAKKILERFREKEIPIFHIQHINLRENATYFLPNTNGVLIHEDVKPLENEKVITKNFPNSFLKTSLLGSQP